MLQDFIICTLFFPSFALGESEIDFLNYTDYYDEEIVENVTFALVTDENDLVDVISKGGNQFYNYAGKSRRRKLQPQNTFSNYFA